MPDNTVSLKNNAEKCILIDASSLFQNRLMNAHSFERKPHAAKPAASSTSSKKSADPIYDPYLIKQISEYLISVNKPWAYRLNAIWCLGITTGCRISALVRKGKKGKASDPDDDYTPLFIIPTSDAVRNELSHFYENPGLMPQVERLLTLASEHKSHLNFSREG